MGPEASLTNNGRFQFGLSCLWRWLTPQVNTRPLPINLQVLHQQTFSFSLSYYLSSVSFSSKNLNKNISEFSIPIFSSLNPNQTPWEEEPKLFPIWENTASTPIATNSIFFPSIATVVKRYRNNPKP